MKFKATLATLAKAARKYKWHLALVAALGLAYWLWCRRSNREPFLNVMKNAISKVLDPAKAKTGGYAVCEHGAKDAAPVGSDGKCPSGYVDSKGSNPDKRCHLCSTAEERVATRKRIEEERAKRMAEWAAEDKVAEEKSKAKCPNGGFGYKSKTGICKPGDILVDGYCIRCRTPEQKAAVEEWRKGDDIVKKQCGGGIGNAFIPKDGICRESYKMVDGYCIRCGPRSSYSEIDKKWMDSRKQGKI